MNENHEKTAIINLITKMYAVRSNVSIYSF